MSGIRLNTVKTNSAVVKSIKVKNVVKSAVTEPAKQSAEYMSKNIEHQSMDRDTSTGVREMTTYGRPVVDISKTVSSSVLYKVQLHTYKNYIDAHGEEIQSTLAKNGIIFEGELKDSKNEGSLSEVHKIANSFSFNKIYGKDKEGPTAQRTTWKENLHVISLGKQAKYAQKMEYKKQSGIRHLPSSVMRIATSKMFMSETAQGYQLITPFFLPVKAAVKQTGRIIDRSVYHIQKKKIYAESKAYHKGLGLSDEAAEKAARAYTEDKIGNYSSHYIKREFKKTIHEKMEPGTKELQKKATKALRKTAEKAAKKAADAETKKAAKKSAKAVAEVSAKLAELLEKGISALGKGGWYIVVIVLILIAAVIVAWMIVFVAKTFITMSTVLSIAATSAPFTLTESQDLDVMIAEVQRLHEEEIDILHGYSGDYEVIDIQYRNGTKENYREIISAAFVQLYEAEDYNDEDVKYIISQLYGQTHKLSVDEYTYLEADGTQKSAAHIYLDIQREDTLCYSVLQNVTVTGGSTNLCPAGTCADDDWMEVVKTVKSLIAQTGTSYSQDAGNSVAINVNGETISVRPDCSAYVSTCLKVYLPDFNENWTSFNFVTNPSLPGFTRYDWSGWENLQEGDIIARYRYNPSNPAASGHVEIFSHNLNGMHYVYSNGSSSSIANPGVTTDSRGDYMVVWRSNAAVTQPEEDEEEENSGELEQDPNIAAFSNMKNLKLDENGNEEGYEVALKATITAISENPSGKFKNAYYDVSTQSHLSEVEESGSTATESPLDFIRVVYAQHGVNVGYDMHILAMGSEDVSYQKAKPGDIILYRPKYDASILPELSDLIQQYRSSLSGRQDDFVTDVSELGTTTDTQAIKDTFDLFVPMIYLGDDIAVAFCKDLTADIADYPSTEAKIRTYNLQSDLDKKQIDKILSMNGFTVNRIYGATNSFSGWTDYNISAMQTFCRSDFWENNQYTIADENGKEETLYFINGYREDYFTGNDVLAGENHYDQFVSDLRPYAILAYENTNVLPSVLIGEAYYRSNGRSTEESLTYNNIYEVTAVDGAVVDIDKYYYAESGDVQTDTVAYYKYDSLQDAITEHYTDMNSRCSIFSSDDNYEAVINRLVNAGYYTGSDAGQIKQMIVSLDIAGFDEIAITRRNHITSAESELNILQAAIDVYGSTESVTQEMHDSLNSYISQASTIINDMYEYIESVALWSERASKAYDDLKALRDEALEISEVQKELLDEQTEEETEDTETTEEPEPEEEVSTNNDTNNPLVEDVSLLPTGALRVSWIRPSGNGINVNSYEIEFSTSRNFSKAATVSVDMPVPTATSATLSAQNVKSGRTYYVRYRYRYNSIYMSAWSETETYHP